MSEKVYLVTSGDGNYHETYFPVALFKDKKLAEMMVAGSRANYSSGGMELKEVKFSDEGLKLINPVGDLREVENDD